jgi:hypothetical protein
MNYLLSKDVWDETNPFPFLRISYLSAKVDWDSRKIDWDLWCEYCNENKMHDFIPKYNGEIDYERAMEGANKNVINDFINWL